MKLDKISFDRTCVVATLGRVVDSNPRFEMPRTLYALRLMYAVCGIGGFGNHHRRP